MVEPLKKELIFIELMGFTEKMISLSELKHIKMEKFEILQRVKMETLFLRLMKMAF